MVNSSMPESVQWAARQQFRRCSRQLLAQPTDPDIHLQRLVASLGMQGTEPLQGALADLFHAVPPTAPLLAQPVFAQVWSHLPPHVAQSFRQLAQQAQPMPHLHPLATRWSILTTVSAELPARARRASSDDAKRMAQELVHALQQGTDDAQEIEANFLAHCSACHDKLAFMLARRELLRHGVFAELPASWLAVAEKLENLHEPGLRA